ncbi:MAG TPA: hypothetical protein VJU54_01875, partial [Nitrospiraceae bacterium]|nr:hypothetical protein [Nitrospiraceae bacterium]
HDKRTSKHGTRFYRPHLWASDVGRFEVVKDEGKQEGTTALKPSSKRVAALAPSRIQMTLPFDDVGGDYVRGTLNFIPRSL